jgi:hypothetical protein
MSKVLTDYLFFALSLIAAGLFLRDVIAYWPNWRSWLEGVGFIAMCSMVSSWLFDWPFRL